MESFGIATKAIIFNSVKQKYLVLKKSVGEEITPNSFDFAGGRIKFKESLEEAVLREAKEETGIEVNPLLVFNAWTFVKEDKDFQLAGIDFLCTTKENKIVLSEEHSEFEWKTATEIINDDKYPKWLKKTIVKAEKQRVMF